MIYLLLIPVLILHVYFLIKLRKIQKHDNVLYRFCESRRKIIAYLRDNYETINKDDYLDIKLVLSITSDSIHYFNEHKITTFNLNSMANLIKTAKNNVRVIRVRINENNENIKNFQYALRHNYMDAILTYTPFIRARITLQIIRILAVIGTRTMKKILRNIKWVNNEYDKLNTLNSNLPLAV